MGRYGLSRGVGVPVWLALVALVTVSCSEQRGAPVGGRVVFDEDVQLVRGEHRDAAFHEFPNDTDATFVAFVYEEDCDVALRLTAAGIAPTSEVDNTMFGQSVEVATLEVPRGARVRLTLDGGRDFDQPCHARTKLLRYDAALARDSRVAARLAALRSWAEATRVGHTVEDTRSRRLGLLEEALAHLESADGDAWLAAWARLVRADLNYFDGIDYPEAARDARTAQAAFEKLGDARNAARGRFVFATVLSELAVDTSSVNPSPEEADRQAVDLLTALSTDPALSAVQRTRALNYLGVHAMGVGRWADADRHYQAALPAFRQLGDWQGQQMVLNNLGVLAAELGDFQLATRYFDQLVAMIDRVSAPRSRVLYMLGAARVDSDAGHVDRAISRMLLAQEWNREARDTQQEARILHALGRAYWARGDLAQASTFFAAGLRVRRTINDPVGVTASLRYAGIMARESGRMDEALRLHREALGLSATPDLRLRGLLDLALDYGAIPDLPRAIATCREALAQTDVSPEFYKRLQTQLTLGDFLLDQPNPGPAAISEAESLVAGPLETAMRRSDVSMELAARHLQARVLVARQKWNEARAEYERAIGLIFRYSSNSTNPELQASAVAREDATFRGYLDLLMRNASARGANVLQPATADELDALQMMEWARATSFSNSRALVRDAGAGARIDSLLAQIAGKRVRLAALQERSAESSRELERLQLDIAQLRAEIDRALAAAQSPGAGRRSSALGMPALPALEPGVVQWSYAIGGQHVYFWVRDAQGVRSTVLPVSIERLERRLAALAAEDPRPSLESQLVPRGALSPAATQLEIVAAGPLVRVPFAALLQPQAPAITMIGSVFHAARDARQRARSWRFVGVAGSEGIEGSKRGGYFSALGAATHEARAIATLFESGGNRPDVKLLLGSQGTVDALAGLWRGGTDVLHIATHGLADLRQPMTSLLMLPANDASGNATYLTAGQVQGWRGDADLVYLSACETAIGPARFADGIPGLQRAFLRAGARGVIATLRPVEDAYASQFATDFYRRYTAGMPASRALAETQRAWMQPAAGVRASEQTYRRMTAWAHAYYVQ
jgi:tetratricopeptide (TPR) repeat protein